uniref:RING-type domain-containing protein n=1 Tax=Eutreptiella gymnastica TaxID=73025 RepID=A0A6T1Z8G9_9EUGL
MGFDPQLFAVKPCGDFLCTVCSEVLDKPMCVCQEGHTFCNACISRWLEKRQTCPTCRCAISQASLRPSRIVENLIGALDVCCRHSGKPNDDDGARSSACDSTSAEEPAAKRQRVNNGCSWTGALQELDGHLGSCGFVPIPCPSGCGARLQRRKLKEHSVCCPKRRVECEHCHEGMPYESLEEHVAQLCPMYLVPCTQKCGQTMPRKQLSAHLSADCPLQPVDCLFMAQGCTVRPRRQSLQQHLSDSAVEHSRLSTERLQALTTEMMGRIDALSKRNAELEGSINGLKLQLMESSRRCAPAHCPWDDDYDVLPAIQDLLAATSPHQHQHTHQRAPRPEPQEPDHHMQPRPMSPDDTEDHHEEQQQTRPDRAATPPPLPPPQDIYAANVFEAGFHDR